MSISISALCVLCGPFTLHILCVPFVSGVSSVLRGFVICVCLFIHVVGGLLVLLVCVFSGGWFVFP